MMSCSSFFMILSQNIRFYSQSDIIFYYSYLMICCIMWVRVSIQLFPSTNWFFSLSNDQSSSFLPLNSFFIYFMVTSLSRSLLLISCIWTYLLFMRSDCSDDPSFWLFYQYQRRFEYSRVDMFIRVSIQFSCSAICSGQRFIIIFLSLLSQMSILSLRSFYLSQIQFNTIQQGRSQSYITFFYVDFFIYFYFLSISYELLSDWNGKYDPFPLLGNTQSCFDDLKNLSFAVLLMGVAHFYLDDFLFNLWLKSLTGFSLCLISFNYCLRLLISAISDPFGVEIETADLTELSLFIFFLLNIYLNQKLYTDLISLYRNLDFMMHMILLYFCKFSFMKCFQKYSMFQDEGTPMGIDSIPDQMRPIAYRNSGNQNFDIILNKFFNNDQLTDIQLQQLNQHQKLIVEEVKRKVEAKTKRPDQYQKLFFKKAFKYAQHSFFKRNKKNRSRRMSQFYHHHFDSVAKTLKIPLINFYHPDKKTKPGLCTGQKSFNSSYVRTVLKSISFRKVCVQYHDKFRQDCRKERDRKISTFSSSIFSMIEKNKQEISKSIRFLQSSKCKIPWSDRDIDQAHTRAAEDLQDFNLDQGNSKKETFSTIKFLQDEGQNLFLKQDIQILAFNDEQNQQNLVQRHPHDQIYRFSAVKVKLQLTEFQEKLIAKQ